jgi:2-amino-4-hydroxy-6-hydroxymethyldihydropteridine diphosphokinase
MTKGYLLGIGSNLSPHHNIGAIIDLLLNHFPSLTMSRILHIPPVGMNSDHDFLNVVIFIETSQSQPELKALCNSIETQLGRDRQDLARKMKDRTADLDIFCAINSQEDFSRPANSVTDEYFLYPLLEEVCAYLMDQPYEARQEGVVIEVNGLSFGQSATTIYRDARTSNKRIVQ